MFSSFGKHSTKAERVQFYGVSKREEQLADIPKIREYEVCISEQRILVQRILCRYSGKEYESNKRIYSKPVGNRQKERSIGIVRSKRPF